MKKLFGHAMSFVKKCNLAQRVLLLLVVVALIVGLVLVLRPDKQPATTQRQVITYSTDTPDEEKPGKDFRWSGLPTDPKRISLPTINAEGYIQNVGVDQKKAVAVPNNIHMAGWFVDTPLPGQQGANPSVLDGHVSGRKNDGIFKDLAKLKKGDKFSVTFGDDSTKDFVVDDVVSLKTEESASVLFSVKPGLGKQLNLITCGGNFDRVKQQYDQRVIAIAKAVE